MTKISLFAHISYQNKKLTPVSALSHYFYLGGTKVVVTNKNTVIRSEQEELPCHIIALKITWFVLSFPLTLPLLAIHCVLRNRCHFTYPPSEEPRPEIEALFRETHRPEFSRSVTPPASPLLRAPIPSRPQEIPQQPEPSNDPAFQAALDFLEKREVTVSTVTKNLSIVTTDMPLTEIKERLISFLKDLRSKGLLLKQSEFVKLSTKNYIKKPIVQGKPDIGRILGRDYIERTARALGLKHIKVPKKLIVIKDDTNFRLSVLPVGMILGNTDPDLAIYAERIEAEDRQMTSEEYFELICLFEETGFADTHDNNWIIAKDGIYITDTEFQSFADKTYIQTRFQYGAITRKFYRERPFAQYKALLEAFNKRREIYQAKEALIKSRPSLPSQIVSDKDVAVSISSSAVFSL